MLIPALSLLGVVLVPLLCAWAWPARSDRPATIWWLALGGAGLAGCALVPATGIHLPLVEIAPGLGFGFLLDRVSLAMAALIGLVAAAVTGYSGRQLLGDPRRSAFLRTLALTLAAATLLVLSANLLLLALCWLLVSAGLHRLLVHHQDRPAAVLAARYKFVVSRIGDLGLATALVILFATFGTLDLRALSAAAGPAQHEALVWVGFALALAAIAKSAQAPLHGWLPETLEAPTAVSALMHAGIVNAGGFLLIRLSPLLTEAAPALTLLVVVGCTTAVLGMLAMWAQTDVKKALAWSTVAQMGFMILECGLGAFAAALIHLLGHGCYKSHAFLRSGSPAVARMPVPQATGDWTSALARWLAALLLAAALTWGVAWITIGSPALIPGGALLLLVISLAAAQLLVAALPGLPWRGGLAAFGLVLVAVPGLHALHVWLGSSLGQVPDLAARGPAEAVLALAVGAVLIALGTLGVLLPWAGRTAWGQALRIHANRGFYLSIPAERALAAWWPHRHPRAEGVLP